MGRKAMPDPGFYGARIHKPPPSGGTYSRVAHGLAAWVGWKYPAKAQSAARLPLCERSQGRGIYSTLGIP